jgi:4-amino-4-deoxy-L-arabinose transferase-like glycosyltransferase
MNTDEGTTSEPTAVAADAPADDGRATPNWWHRDHPVFAALSGFFTGLVLVIVVPGAFAAVLAAIFSTERAEELFPFVLLIFVVPIGLTAAPRTRRFGKYLLLGMLLTAVVVAGVAALVLYILIRRDG